MNACLRAGHNIEFFLEGGRTRTGKPCMPKYGVFSVILESFIDGTIEDALLVPVSINYEKLIDGNFVREQLGQPKEIETFSNAVKGIWKVLNSNYGNMRVDFSQPFSLRVSHFQNITFVYCLKNICKIYVLSNTLECTIFLRIIFWPESFIKEEQRHVEK